MQSDQTQKTTHPITREKECLKLAAIKASSGPTSYQVADTHGNPVVLKQAQASPIDKSATVSLTQGGHIITLTKQNISDLQAAFATFAATGVLS